MPKVYAWVSRPLVALPLNPLWALVLFLNDASKFVSIPKCFVGVTGVPNVVSSPYKIYGDKPRTDLTISSFPRISFRIYNFTTAIAGYGNVLNSNWRFGVKVYATSSKQADELIDKLRELSIDNNTKLYYTYHMYPIDILDLGVFDLEKGKTKIYVQGLNVMCDNNFEIN